MEFPANTALLVIDVQEAINRPEAGRRNNPQAEENMVRLLAAWRAVRLPIFHVKDNAPSPDSAFHITKPGNAIMAFARPLSGEPLIEKETHSAFVGTGLESRLRQAGITTLVIAGFVTNHCVESTARMCGDLGFDAYVVSDATAAHERTGVDGRTFDADLVHGISLASLHCEFAIVVDTATVMAAVEMAATVGPD